MDYSQYDLLTLFFLGGIAILTGFVDAVVGGGGLIQVPALLINLPKVPLATIFGTNKIASLLGSSTSAVQYAKRVKFSFGLLAVTGILAAVASYMGAKALGMIPVEVVRPIILFVLIGMAIYTFFKKDLGSLPTKHLPAQKQWLYGGGIGLVVGFYDGFLGPGTGTFLILGFVVLLGFDFITASGYAKVINCITNLAAVFVFVRQGNYLPEIALLLTVFNIIGNLVGTRLALQKGNSFVRTVFLFVVSMMILRYGYDIIRQSS